MLVTPMAPRGTEFIIGITEDPQHGPVMLFGLGGVFVEVIGDVVFRALPVTTDDALDMIGSLKHPAVLDGVRGSPPVDREALAALLVGLSRIREQHPGIAEIDLNPVIAHAGGLAVVDARIVLHRNTPTPD
jgi:acyl-CoA synthetase (NDP forming)